MDAMSSRLNIITFTSWILSLILDANQSLELPVEQEFEDDYDDIALVFLDAGDCPILDTLGLMQNTLHNYRICCTPFALPAEVSYWIKPRSTTWFCRFLVEQYDNSRWISMFRMTQAAVLKLVDLLRPYVEKQDTKYRLAIPVLIRVACTLFKLTNGANLTICSEMFAIGRSIVSKVLREVVHAVNDNLKHELSWPSDDTLRDTQEKFSSFCSLPAVVGAINGMHISISKPDFDASDYYYFKTGGYSIHCQAVVDSEKRFLHVYAGMPGSTHDSCVLRRSALHYLASHHDLFGPTLSVDGHSPYLIGDLGYPLLPWLMVPHRVRPDLSVSERLFNKRLRRGRSVVENAFGIFKHSFHELLDKSELHITFMPDVILCCCILHNVLLRQSHQDVEELLRVLASEGFQGPPPRDDRVARLGGASRTDDITIDLARQKRDQLGIYLTTRRRANATVVSGSSTLLPSPSARRI